MNTKQIAAYLEILTHSAVCPGASHYNGKIIYDEERGKLELAYTLTAKVAREYNKAYTSKVYKAGNKTDKFPDRESLIEEAIKQFKYWLTVHGYKILLEGKSYDTDPLPVLYCSDEGLEQELQSLLDIWN